MPRKFKLLNANNETYDLSEVGHAMYEPDGLGWGETVQLTRLGQTFLVTDTQVDQPIVSGRIVFWSYQEYNNFLKFAQAGGLIFGYMPIQTWRYIKCVCQIGKQDIDHDLHRLICDVVFTGTSQWYEATKYYQAEGALPGNAKKYAYSYPYKYAGAAGGAEIFNGALPSYFVAYIEGAVTNPRWTLYVGGTAVKSGRLIASVPAGDYIAINTDPTEAEIAEYKTSDDSFIKDLYGYSDWTTERLFMIPAGECSLVFAEEGGTTPNATVEVRQRV